jgi:C-terminal processing protease CtpA/Prc
MLSTTYFCEILCKLTRVKVTLIRFGFLVALASTGSIGATTLPAQERAALTEEGAKRDVGILKRALSELHPALTKYQSRADIDAAFARFESRGNAARTAAEMYLAATELAAAIRCGHTWTNTLNQSGATKRALLESANKLPFTLAVTEGRWLILASADAQLRAGDEVLAINGTDGPMIVQRMLPYLRADGASDGKRIVQLSHDRADFSMMDIVWPLLSPPADDTYTVRVSRAGEEPITVRTKATTLAARRAALVPLPGTPSIPSTPGTSGESWTFRIENQIGYLTLPTFAFWQSRFDWNKFLENTFAELKQRNVSDLIIDIRRNEGGDGAISTALLSYLIDKPVLLETRAAYSAYERAPYILMKHLDTWNYDFFDRTGKVEKIAERRYRVTTSSPAPRTLNPHPLAYTGRARVLISAENSSATFQFAELVKRFDAAVLIGQTTGGNLRGLNGGELTWVTLPHSGVAVDIPLLSGEAATSQPDRGIDPNITVSRTFAARSAGRDVEMEAAIAHVARQTKVSAPPAGSR